MLYLFAVLPQQVGSKLGNFCLKVWRKSGAFYEIWKEIRISTWIYICTCFWGANYTIWNKNVKKLSKKICQIQRKYRVFFIVKLGRKSGLSNWIYYYAHFWGKIYYFKLRKNGRTVQNLDEIAKFYAKFKKNWDNREKWPKSGGFGNFSQNQENLRERVATLYLINW